MNTTAPEGEQKKAYTAKAQVNAYSSGSTSCSFCWFVLITYPTLKAMTLKDEAAFQEHLKKAHGLSPEIQP
jgi:hypothetical protein